MYRTPLHNARYSVPGLRDNGDPQRGLASRAIRAVGRGVLSVADELIDATDGEMVDDGPDNGSKHARTRVFGQSPDCLAVTAIRPWHNKTIASLTEISGCWVLTPRRLAWLVPHRGQGEADQAGIETGAGNHGQGRAGDRIDGDRRD
ncbi:hypothetical protein [Actinokineospora inagensis]|uniref:hypothetical protein n=1 Tax=Actinokineospora inagensis TaxID=103730 RepID=UPI0003F68BE6|nr:hypothetical protein [Actinokineospora inagensis]